MLPFLRCGCPGLSQGIFGMFSRSKLLVCRILPNSSPASLAPYVSTRNVSYSRKVPEVLEDSGDALNLLWSATQPYLRDGLAGPAAPSITRSVVQLMHAFLTKGGPSAGEALVASGAVAPAVHVSTRVVVRNVNFGGTGGIIVAVHRCVRSSFMRVPLCDGQPPVVRGERLVGLWFFFWVACVRSASLRVNRAVAF